MSEVSVSELTLIGQDWEAPIRWEAVWEKRTTVDGLEGPTSAWKSSSHFGYVF